MTDESPKLSRRGFLGGTAAAAVAGAAHGLPIQEAARSLLSTVTIPPQSGRGVYLQRDQWVKVISPDGPQVADLFAFVRAAPDEFLCPRTTMTRQRRLYPQLGEPFYSNKRRALLMLEEDTVGVHDLFYPACDSYMYAAWEHEDVGRDSDEPHPSCRDNLNIVLREMEFEPGGYAEPHNLFQNSPAVDMEGHLEVRESPAKPGDYVLLKALDDLLVVTTSCSVDRGVLNGERPTPIVLEVYA